MCANSIGQIRRKYLGNPRVGFLWSQRWIFREVCLKVQIQPLDTRAYQISVVHKSILLQTTLIIKRLPSPQQLTLPSPSYHPHWRFLGISNYVCCYSWPITLRKYKSTPAKFPISSFSLFSWPTSFHLYCFSRGIQETENDREAGMCEWRIHYEGINKQFSGRNSL